MRIQNHVEGYDRGVLPPVIPALLAQPIVETCLRIPTWDWCRGGINRAIAREAFSTALPARVIARRSKSGPERLTAEVFEFGRPVPRAPIGRASCRERVCQYVEVPGGAGSLKKKK